MDIAASILSSLAGLIVMMLGVLLLCVAFTFVWIKWQAHGKVGIVFIDSRKIYSRLMTEDTVNACVWRGPEGHPDREKYKLIPDKVFELTWPASLPWFLQEHMRAWMFTRNNEEPWDPSNAKVLISARMSRMTSDEALLRTMWKDLRQAVGAGEPTGGVSRRMVLLMLGIAIMLSAISAIMSYNANNQVGADHQTIQRIYNLLGGK